MILKLRKYTIKRLWQKIPEYGKAWSNLGLLYTRQGRYERAIKAFSKIMGSSQASNNVGYICMEDGDYIQAQKFFKEAIKLSSTHFVDAYKNLEEAKRRTRLGADFQNFTVGQCE